MTRRILAGFLGVLLVLLALVVVPLGLKLSGQERSDFRRSTMSAARSLAAAAEESLGDTRDPADHAPPRLPVDHGDTLLLFDRAGRAILVTGMHVSASLAVDAAAGRPVSLNDHIVAIAAVGKPGNPDGRLVLVRDAAPLDHQLHELWLALVLAAVAALALGALTAFVIARWIGRPLRALQTATGRMGRGDVGSRAPTTAGPPEVKELATTFNEMAERIGSLLDRQRTMTADVSHQLRTPLSALRLRLELLAEDSEGPTQAELVDGLREIDRLSRLVDGLLAVARAEEATAMPEPTALASLVDQRVALWRPVAEEKQVLLTSSTRPATIAATTGHVEQILDNLIANALDALGAGQVVDVSTATDNGAVLLTVRDNGAGMSPERRSTAFDRFEGDRSGRKSGLGLAIVARLVAADHGHIALTETDGGGLSATVRWPAR